MKHELQKLKVFDKLIVGLVKLEKKRLIMPYTVESNNNSDTFELIYKYEENVFDPKNENDLDLAAMIGAQVSLNYGLFFDQIHFNNAFDKSDQTFLKEMMDNTSREIYVKKFLEPNPFLKGAVANLPVIKANSYTNAKLHFLEEKKFNPTKEEWAVNKSSIAVLSSGGKDSLLSFGFLSELNYSVHPIFINESGRHWYTALNAYRYLKNNHESTTKIWTNADRLFVWMLRHFPFIRKDFASLRSDEYPIRLWTVAVFLFGALPLLRKREISRLVIGDEFDTTLKKSFNGISHFNGLYDQSRYFDNAMTRYFMRKNWQISQFSILRPLSELLIQKILVERFPDLQKHQVSCHATHIKDNRVYPCGTCEKCNRIMAMLTAIGADPQQCGYSQKQIINNLQSILKKEIHQESAGVKQMLFMLSEKGLIDSTKIKKSKLIPHQEILKVRIDPERSPISDIPLDLRQPLYKIFLEHADGSIKKTGRIWQEIDILNDKAINEPYIFESAKLQSGKTNVIDKKRNFILGELTWPQAKDRLKEVDIALLPVGAIEQHGPHLPLDTDAFDAIYLSEKVAEACKDPKPLVLPLISYGVSYHHDDFPGTISITNDTLSKIVYDIGMGAAHNGITKLVIINGHGGNVPSLKFAAQMINRDAQIFTAVESGDTSDVDLDRLCETPNDVHAGEIETSTSLAIRPELVNMGKSKKFVPKFSSHYLDFTTKRSVEWFARTSKISPTGILGDPTKASAEKGKKMWAVMIKNLVELVEHLKSLTLNEIYEKRY
jgi:creatinine amidohydrolase/Fe(II)-dependent formamide hydrolase-like protein